jgi:microcystin-dependent protein
MQPQALGVSGGGAPHNNMQPYLPVNFIIAMQGIYPPRD